MLQNSHSKTFSGTENLLTSRSIPFTRNWPLHCLMAGYAALWGFLVVSPVDPMQWWLENILVFAVIIALAFTYNKFRLSNLSFLLIFLFLVIHTYAAHYTYESTPVDLWVKSAFHTRRSYFDRFAHFAFGCVWVVPLREIVPRELNRRLIWMLLIPLAIVFSCSSIYEVIEMIGAVSAKQAGEKYIGLQGDIYDSQKDMALGFLGALLSSILLAVVSRKKRKAK